MHISNRTLNTAGATAQQTSRGGAAVPASNATPTDDGQSPASRLKVKWESEKLSLGAEAVPLSEVLLGISRATGIEIAGTEGLSNLVSMHIAEAELRSALHDLLVQFDYAIKAGLQDSASPRGAANEKNAPSAEAANQALDDKPADAGTRPSEIASMQTASAGPPQPPTQDTGPIQPPDQDAGPLGMEAPSENVPATDVQLDPIQMAKLAAIDAAAASQDADSLGKFMQDANATVQAAASNASSALDNPAAVANLRAQINHPRQPGQLQALELLAQSPRADEQVVMTA